MSHNDKQKGKMKNLTITVNGKSGEIIYFYLQMTVSNFLKVIDMTFETVEDVLQGEKQGIYTIQK